jgi:hypothetical protein
MASFKSDNQYGLSAESIVINVLKQLDPTIKKTAYEYAAIDFEGDTAKIEHKQRKVTSTAFYDTIIPADKAIKTDKKLYFSFGFSDGKIGYIEYNETNFKDIAIKPFKRNQRIDYNDKEKPYFFIPVSRLTWLNASTFV